MPTVQVVRSIGPGLLNHTSQSALAESWGYRGYWLETKFQAVITISLKTSGQVRVVILGALVESWGC